MGQYYTYRSDDKNNLSLRCPAIGCECGTFAKVFDDYGVDLKKALLVNTKSNCEENEISWNWSDCNYVGKDSKNKKQSMKKCVALHFARAMYVEENPSTKYLTSLDKLKVKNHSLDMIPVTWKSYVSQESNKMKIKFKNDEN